MRPSPVLRHRRPELLERATVRDPRTPVPIPATHSNSLDGIAALLGITSETSNVTASEKNVTGIAAVQAGIDMVAHGVATMLTEATVHDINDNELDTPLIVSRPTALLGSYEFWTQAIDCAMKRGNYIAILADFDNDGYAQQVVPAHPDAVSLDDTTGLPYYTIGAATYRWDEVVHVRHGATVGSLWGCGIVERYRLALQRQLSELEYGRTSFAGGGVPTMVVQLDKATVTTDEAEAVQDRLIERHGTTGARKPLVTGKGMTITPVSWSPEDAEFIEARQLSIAEAALMCGLDPSDLSATVGSSSLTYANLTERQLARILQSFTPWMTLFEQAWSDLRPYGDNVHGSPEALLRSSTKERFEIFDIGHRLGIYTTDELRAIEKRPALIPATAPTDPEEES
jgi:HK97 family phage portal protein